MLALIASSACETVPPPPPVAVQPAPGVVAPERRLFRQEGRASWYGDFHHGRKTASGDIFDKNAFTAAHRTLPLRSRVRVTNLENGRTVEVVINDRGPYARGRVIDLSEAAARALGFAADGLALVRVEEVP